METSTCTQQRTGVRVFMRGRGELPTGECHETKGSPGNQKPQVTEPVPPPRNFLPLTPHAYGHSVSICLYVVCNAAKQGTPTGVNFD